MNLFSLFLRPLESAELDYMVSDELEAWFAPPEYVILRKLEFYQEGESEKHLNDIRGMLDQPAIEHLRDSSDIADWTTRLGLDGIWQRLRRDE